MQKTIERYGIAIVAGSVATVGFLFVMQSVLVSPYSSLSDVETSHSVGLMDKPVTTVSDSVAQPSSNAGELQPGMPQLDSAGSDSEPADVTADKSKVAEEANGNNQGETYLIRSVSPVYPSRALERGIEGYVVLEFTISETGSVIDPVVAESEPSGIFEQAALEVSSKLRYRPRIVAGVPIATESMRHRFDFEIEDDDYTSPARVSGHPVPDRPLRWLRPNYPLRALQRGIEGHVVLEFTIDETGSAIDPAVVESEPPGIFDQSAIDAASKLKYKPLVVGGKAIQRQGIKYRFVYELNDNRTEDSLPYSENKHGDIPIGEVAPLYPERALQRGIEGHVVVEFTVSKSGSVVDPVVVDSEPLGIFDRSAIDAASKLKFKPPIVDGQNVQREGVKHRFEFDLESATGNLQEESRDLEEYLPLRHVSPTYPERALLRGIEGHVLMEFTVTENGSVTNQNVLESEPLGIFDRVALEASSKFKYRPRIVDGSPVETEGVRYKFTFELE